MFVEACTATQGLIGIWYKDIVTPKLDISFHAVLMAGNHLPAQGNPFLLNTPATICSHSHR